MQQFLPFLQLEVEEIGKSRVAKAQKAVSIFLMTGKGIVLIEEGPVAIPVSGESASRLPVIWIDNQLSCACCTSKMNKI